MPVDVKMMGFWSLLNNLGTKMSQIYQMYLGRKMKIFNHTHTNTYTQTYTHKDSILDIVFSFKCFHCQPSMQRLIYSTHSCISLSQDCPGDKTKFILVQQHFTFFPPLNTFHQWSFIYTFWFSKIPCSNILSQKLDLKNPV